MSSTKFLLRLCRSSHRRPSHNRSRAATTDMFHKQDDFKTPMYPLGYQYFCCGSAATLFSTTGPHTVAAALPQPICCTNKTNDVKIPMYPLGSHKVFAAALPQHTVQRPQAALHNQYVSEIGRRQNTYVFLKVFISLLSGHRRPCVAMTKLDMISTVTEF